MIITRLGGGLGNQMFQYALGRALSIKLDSELLVDLSGFGSDSNMTVSRKYGLSHFNIKAGIATPEQIETLRYPHGKFIKNLLTRIEWKLGKKHIKFEPNILKKTGDIFLDGYWQSPKYFKDIRNVLLDDFKLKEPMSEKAQKIADDIDIASSTVSVHIRRGDYTNSESDKKFYGTHCDRKYYTQSMRIIADKRSSVTSMLRPFVFSDDIEWVRQNMSDIFGEHATYISANDISDYETIVLMSLCQDHIIANSTFSWWGAWLDKKPNATITAPSVWIPGLDLPVDDILPPHWIRVP